MSEGRLEDEGEATHVLPVDLAVFELDVEANADAACLCKRCAIASNANGDGAGRRIGCLRGEDCDSVAVDAADGCEQLAAGQLSDLLCLLRADEEGEVACCCSVFEVAAAAGG